MCGSYIFIHSIVRTLFGTRNCPYYMGMFLCNISVLWMLRDIGLEDCHEVFPDWDPKTNNAYVARFFLQTSIQFCMV